MALTLVGTAMGGIPQVISESGEPYTFRSGETLTIKIQVQNIGTGVGNFIVQDINGGTLKSAMFPVSVPADGTSTITFAIVTSGKKTESGTITGKVVDTGSLKESPFSFNYEMKAPRQCIEGEISWTGGNVIYICNDDAELVVYKDCPDGVTANDDYEWVCKSNPTPNPSNKSMSGFGAIFASIGIIMALKRR
ncbi:MAG: hypothetical protein KAT05_15240 [Spirochaetes bacterium]|nr:hypothetical protein [Spirochaetota bacterium]